MLFARNKSKQHVFDLAKDFRDRLILKCTNSEEVFDVPLWWNQEQEVRVQVAPTWPSCDDHRATGSR